MIEEKQRAKTSSNPESDDTVSGRRPSAELPTLDIADRDLKKIREILFGKQIRDNDKQLREMRADLERQISSLAESQNQQLGNLQRNLDTTLEQINQRFVAFEQENTVNLSLTSNKLAAAEHSLIEKITQLSKNSTIAQDQLKLQIDNTMRCIDQSLDATRVRIMRHVESSLAELRSQNVDRSALSSLLGEVANQLSGQSSTDTVGTKKPQPMGKVDGDN